MPDRMPDRMPHRMPDRMPDRMPEDMSEYMPEDMPDRMPDRMPEDMSEYMPEDMPDRMPEDLPDRMPEDMPEHMPEDMPDRMPNRMSEDMSDRMPKDLPVRKCINYKCHGGDHLKWSNYVHFSNQNHPNIMLSLNPQYTFQYLLANFPIFHTKAVVRCIPWNLPMSSPIILFTQALSLLSCYIMFLYITPISGTTTHIPPPIRAFQKAPIRRSATSSACLNGEFNCPVKDREVESIPDL